LPGGAAALIEGAAWIINGITGPLQKAIYGPGYRPLSPKAQQLWNRFAPQLDLLMIAGFNSSLRPDIA
jgi:hypothetical protein